MKCKICTEEKEINDFVKEKNSKLGYRTICKKCHYQRSRKWIAENKEKNDENRKKWDVENKEKNNNYKKKYKEKNEEIVKENSRRYWKSPKGKLYRSEYRKRRRENDVLYHLECSVRSSIKQSFRRNRQVKKSNTTKILGCSISEFRSYLESKFESWMNWGNYGKYDGTLNFGWDLDHIIPISIAKNEEEVIKLNHYTNLQPLCSKVNRDIKTNKNYEKE